MGFVRGCSFCVFLSTLSLRRATWARGSRVTYVEISIHALLAESDTVALEDPESDFKFLSTLSLRRATFSPGFGFC